MSALARQPVFGTLDVTGIQRAQNGVVAQAVFGVSRHHHLITLAVHMVDQTAQVFTGNIGLEGPGDVGVPEDHGGVGHAFHHHVLVDHLFLQHHALAIHGGPDAAQHLDIQAGGRNDDIRFQLLAGFQANARVGEAFNMVGFDRGSTRLDGIKQVAVFHHAQALIPGVVVGGKVAHIRLALQLALDHRQEQPAHGLRALAGTLVEQARNRDIPGPGQPIGGFLRQYLLQRQGDLISRRQRHQIGGRTLQHGDMGGFFRHGRHQGNRSRTTANHHHFLSGVIQVLRPVLRVHHLAFEVFLAGEIRLVALIVVVVTSAAHQETGRVGLRLAGFFVLRRQLPAFFLTGPVRCLYRHTVADVPFHIVFPGGVGHVLLDRSTIGQHLATGPGPEVVAKGEHVGIGANAGVTEQIPGTAQRLSALQNGEALAGTFPFQMAGHANAGNPGANDQDVIVLLTHNLLPRIRIRLLLVTSVRSR